MSQVTSQRLKNDIMEGWANSFSRPSPSSYDSCESVYELQEFLKAQLRKQPQIDNTSSPVQNTICEVALCYH